MLLRNINNSVGIDEAGRGSWAGPVVASAVYIRPEIKIDGINDSKKLSKSKREKLYELIKISHIVGVGIASVEEIDEVNILQATILAMRRAVQDINFTPEILLIDGNYNPDLGVKSIAIIEGDSKYESIAAASIIAKVTRDRIMQDLGRNYPEYDWHKNAGYGTRDHVLALQCHGVNEHHRKSYKPIRGFLTIS